jgi:hypothetical protein
VMEVAQVGAMFKMGLQVGEVKFWCSCRGVPVGCCEFLVSIFRESTRSVNGCDCSMAA